MSKLEGSGSSAAPTPAPREPLRVWRVWTPFRKDGTPVMGNMGSSVREVIVMEREEFRRLIAENPCLADTPFEIGEF